MNWGFEGWVTLEFDIAADGKTTIQRPIIACPPFVFGDAAIGVCRRWRFQQSFRPEGGRGCGGAQKTIGFQISQF